MASNDVAIKVTNVSKSFKLPHDKQNSIKGGLISLVKNGKRTYENKKYLKMFRLK
jgi:ABC-type polysaccharide/polyol phosphate transport system ATPase subunit